MELPTGPAGLPPLLSQTGAAAISTGMSVALAVNAAVEGPIFSA